MFFINQSFSLMLTIILLKKDLSRKYFTFEKSIDKLLKGCILDITMTQTLNKEATMTLAQALINTEIGKQRNTGPEVS